MSRILVVDDEQHIADGLRVQPRGGGPRGGRRLRRRARARTAAARRATPFDVVILDVMLPGKDGFEIAAELRAAGQYVPILMLTARGRAEDVLRGFEAGADDYLPKPFELAILLARVNGLLRRRRWNERDTPPADDAARRLLHLRRARARFRGDGGARAGPVVPADADGERPAAVSGAEPGPGRVARRDPRERLGPARAAPTRAPSTTSSCVSGATSRTTVARRGSC